LTPSNGAFREQQEGLPTPHAEFLHDIAHKLRAPVGILLRLEPDLATTSPLCQELFFQAVARIKEVAERCGDESRRLLSLQNSSPPGHDAERGGQG
jgi:hypothetical protein